MKDLFYSKFQVDKNSSLGKRVLVVASLVTACIVGGVLATAVVQLALFALPILAIGATVLVLLLGIPMSILSSERDAVKPSLPMHDPGVMMSLEGFWKHAMHSSTPMHLHEFQMLDQPLRIHLESEAGEHETAAHAKPMTEKDQRPIAL